MIIKIKIKQVYGQERIYVVGAETASYIQILTNQKTLDRGQIAALKFLGCTFEIVQETV